MSSRPILAKPWWIALALLLPVVGLAETGLLREASEAAPCFLYCYGKGPNGMADLRIKFDRQWLNLKQPYVDDRKTASPEALIWIDRQVKPEIRDVLRVRGRRLMEVTYTDAEVNTRGPGTVLVAFETAPGSNEYRPLVVVMPELFDSVVVSGEDIPLGYVFSLRFSGTGAAREHVVFDFSADTPRVVRRLSAGRIVRQEFDSDEAYEAALPLWDEEADLFAGKLWPDDKSFEVKQRK